MGIVASLPTGTPGCERDLGNVAAQKRLVRRAAHRRCQARPSAGQRQIWMGAPARFHALICRWDSRLFWQLDPDWGQSFLCRSESFGMDPCRSEEVSDRQCHQEGRPGWTAREAPLFSSIPKKYDFMEL